MPRLFFLNGPRQNEDVEIGPGGSLVIGRASVCSLRVPDEAIAERHAQIKEHGGRYFVRDLGAESGTFLNDRPIKTAEVQIGDELRVGSTRLRFEAETLETSPAQQTPSSSKAAPAPAAPREERAKSSLVGKVLSGYRVEEKLGQGGMGTVYRATQLSLDREVALKILSPKLTRDSHFVEQFVREARAAGQLNHAHIVQVYDVSKDGALYFYAMEYVGGGSVAQKLKSEESLDPQEGLRIALEAAHALSYAEHKKIVHRDIKPDNLMLTELGQVKIADLGLARSLAESAAKEPEGILGTPHFIAPEQVLRKPVDIRSDIYALGATLYMMLAGRTPFTGADAKEILRKQVKEEPKPIREIAPQVPEKVSALIERMMKKDPDERPESAEALVEELSALREKRRKTALIVVPMVVLGLSGALFGLLREKETETKMVEKVIHTGVEVSELEKKEQERQQLEFKLEATQAWANLPQAEDRDARIFDLQGFIETFKESQADAVGQAQDELDRLLAAIKAEKDADAAVSSKALARQETLQTEVQGHIDNKAFERALQALHSPEEDENLRAHAPFLAFKEEQIAAVIAAIRTQKDSLIQNANAFIDAKDYEEARTQLNSLASLNDREWPQVEGFTQEFQTGLQEELQGLESRLEQSQAREALASRVQDLQRLTQVVDQGLLSSFIALDYSRGKEAIQTTGSEFQSPLAGQILGEWSEWLAQGQDLKVALIAAVNDKSVVETRIQIQGDTKRYFLQGASESGLTLAQKSSGGEAKVETPFSDFASGDGIDELFAGRLEWSAAQMAQLARLALITEIARMIRGHAELQKALSQYDAQAGWLPATSLSASPRPIARWRGVKALIERARQLGAPDAAALEESFQQESEALRLLCDALDSFYEPDDREQLAVSASVLLDRLVERHRHSLTVLLAYPLLDGGDSSLDLLEESSSR